MSQNIEIEQRGVEKATLNRYSLRILTPLMVKTGSLHDFDGWFWDEIRPIERSNRPSMVYQVTI